MKRILLLFLFSSFLLLPAVAQRTNRISLTSRNSNVFTITNSVIAGENLPTFTNNSQVVEYSVREKGNLYAINVATFYSTIPQGIILKIEAGDYLGTGNSGISTGPQIVSNNPVSIITNLGQSGVGQYLAYELIVSIEISDIELLIPQTSSIFLVYTITAQ